MCLNYYMILKSYEGRPVKRAQSQTGHICMLQTEIFSIVLTFFHASQICSYMYNYQLNTVKLRKIEL